MNINRFSHRYYAPAGDDGSDAGIDRGDNVVVTDDAVDLAAVDTAAADVVAADAAAADQPRAEDGKFAKKEAITIPKVEFDRRIEKERLARVAAEQRAADLESQIKRVDQTEASKALDDKIEDLEDKLESARLDGDKEKAKQFAKELRLLEREVATAAQTSVGNMARDQAREEMRLDLVIEKLEGQYPVLQDGSDDFDQDIVDLVLATQRDLINRERLSPSVALESAVNKVMAKITPAVEKTAATGLGAAKDVAGDRKTAQVAKNLDAAAKQPASLKEVGLDGDKAGQSKDTPAATDMTYEEFNALPETTKAKMRGDLV